MAKDSLAKIWRAVVEFDMLQEGDKVLVGLSGGKDSMFLTSQLAEVQKHATFRFELACFTVNTMFTSDFPRAELQNFCQQYNLAWYSEDVDVQQLIREKDSPCYSCAYFRRAVVNRKAAELGFNKVALAHHHDDAVETFFMNLMTSGQLKTFKPVTNLSRSGITVIRPLLYCREEEVADEVKAMGLQPLKNPCPYDGHTMRQSVKEHIAELNDKYPEIYEHLSAAMRKQDGMELWPAKLTKEQAMAKFKEFWKDKA